MNKFLSSIFLISGTAIGAGLISLPISAAKVGMTWTFVIIMLALFVAYKTSCITIDLMKAKRAPLTIVELAHEISGNGAKFITMCSYYILSLALLSVYFSGTIGILNQFLNINSTILCVCLFACLFFLKSNIFAKINTAMVLTLFGLIISVILSSNFGILDFNTNNFDFSATMLLFPIMFTSFGIQNVCAFVAKQLGLENLKAIKKAFLIGTTIPAIIYILWIYGILNRVFEFDINLYNKILSEGVDVGVLISSLCNSAKFEIETLILKLLSLFAILTSATGIGIGLISSLCEIFSNKFKLLISSAVVLTSATLAILVQNAFMTILSFDGMIATIFVIFIPIYLSLHIQKIPCKKIPGYVVCFIFGLIIIYVELLI